MPSVRCEPTAVRKPGIRADKWLWQARFFKTRSLAAGLVTGGHLRVNARRVSKAAHMVSPGDVLTFVQARQVRVVRVLATGRRRGPAAEAQALYDDLSPPQEKVPHAPAYEGKGRPGRKDRRNAFLSGRSELD